MDSCSDITLHNSSSLCDCYKKLQVYGIPLHIKDENDYYAEHQKIISNENAFELPGYLEINEDIKEYPVVDYNNLSYVFQQMAEVIPKLSEFKLNVLSFWILDVMIEGLRTAQSAKMSFEHQKATLLWIAYFYNYIQKKNPTRSELFKQLKTILFECDNKTSKDVDEDKEETSSGPSQTGESYASSKKRKTDDFPLPPELFTCKRKSESRETISEPISDAENNLVITESGEEREILVNSMSDSKNKENTAETNLKSMIIILDILYRIFGRLWVYLEIQTVFHSMPAVVQVDLPFTLTAPKPLFNPKPPTPIKTEKPVKKTNLPEKSCEKIDSEIQLHKNDYIFPLQMSEEAKSYVTQLFPQSATQRSALGKNKEDKIKK